MGWLLKRWWFWTWTAFILVAICAGYLLIPIEKSRITQANCDRVTNLRYRWEDEDGNRIDVWFETETGQVAFKWFSPSDLSPAFRIKRRIQWRVRAL
jgi:hypothetical protein